MVTSKAVSINRQSKFRMAGKRHGDHGALPHSAIDADVARRFSRAGICTFSEYPDSKALTVIAEDARESLHFTAI